MFIFHVAYSLGLIALTAGCALYLWSFHSQGMEKNFSKILGLVIIILSIGSILCTSYYGIKYWQQGHFEAKMPMHMSYMDNNN